MEKLNVTECEWLRTEDPMEMLEFLWDKASNRKLRLVAVACCRHVWDWLPEHARKAVETAERYADKQATRAELSRARKDVEIDEIAQGYLDGATACASDAARWKIWEAVTGVVRAAPSAPRTPELLRVKNAKRKTEAMHTAANAACERRYLAESRAQ
jgi:hypothetical protein